MKKTKEVKAMSNDNVHILTESLRILNAGCYELNGKTVTLQLSKARMEASQVLLPDDVRKICDMEPAEPTAGGYRCSCVRADSFAAALDLSAGRAGRKPVLVLNFANPVNIGGGVYRGARAQEEDLCRRSSLLRSLENSNAESYYRYNRSLGTYMGSDAMIFSPEVEVFRDEEYALMEKTAIVAVVTCAAPLVNYGLEGMSESEYEDMFYTRIVRLLKCAAYLGYEDLVLGAWGCGAFGNDAALVSDLFSRALENLRFGDRKAQDLFHSVVFAVRSRDGMSYNYLEFLRNFGG